MQIQNLAAHLHVMAAGAAAVAAGQSGPVIPGAAQPEGQSSLTQTYGPEGPTVDSVKMVLEYRLMVAGNQQRGARYFEQEQCGLLLDARNYDNKSHLDNNELRGIVHKLLESNQKRKNCAQNGRSFIDGQGVDRVIDRLTSLTE